MTQVLPVEKHCTEYVYIYLFVYHHVILFHLQQEFSFIEQDYMNRKQYIFS